MIPVEEMVFDVEVTEVVSMFCQHNPLFELAN